MFCQNCGTQNADNAVFCKNCGASIMNQQAQQQQTFEQNQQNQQTYQQQNYQQNYQQQTYQQNYQQAYRKMEKIYSSNPAINAVKKIAASPIFLTGAILYSVYVLFQLISTFSGNAVLNIVKTAVQMSGEIGYDEFYAFEQMLDGMQAGAVIGGLLGMIPTLLVLLAVWLIFAAGRNVMDQGMKTAGLTIIKVISIISLVLLCVGMGLGVVGIVILIVVVASLPEMAGGMLSNMSYYGGDYADYYDYGYGYGYEDQIEEFLGAGAGVVVGILIFVFIIFAAVFVVNLLYHIKTIKTLNSIKNTVNSGVVTGNISMYLIVMLFINAAGNILNFNLAGISCGVALIMFAVALIKLRGEFKKQEELNQPQPNYGYNPNMNYQAQSIPNNNF